MTASGHPLSAALTEQLVGILEGVFAPNHDMHVVAERHMTYSIERDLQIVPDGTPTQTGLVPSVLRVEQFYQRLSEDQPRYIWKLTHGTREDAPRCELRWDGRLIFSRPVAETEEEWNKNSTFTSTVATEREGQACLMLLLDIQFASR